VGLIGHFNSIFVNNQMLAGLEQLHSSPDVPNQAQRIANREKALAAYADALKKGHNDLQDTVKALLASSETWLASHPAR
jgi:FtsZ-binding cell division protein ZapB